LQFPEKYSELAMEIVKAELGKRNPNKETIENYQRNQDIKEKRLAENAALSLSIGVKIICFFFFLLQFLMVAYRE